MNLYLVRHTKVDYPKGICYGQTDVGVMPSFPEEADAIKKQLEGVAFSKVFASPLTRCKKLVNEICPAENEIVFDARLMELDFGDWEGLAWNDIEKTEIAQVWFQDFLNTVPPGGESYKTMVERIRSFMSDLGTGRPDENLLIVCHSGSIRAFYSIIKGISPQAAFDLELDYGQVCVFEKSVKQ